MYDSNTILNYDNKKHSFARGFLITKGKPINAPEHWDQHIFKEWYLTVDPRVDVNSLESSGLTTIIVGNAFNATKAQFTEAFLRELNNCINEIDKQAILDQLCGRYVVVSMSEKLLIQQDSAGLRSVFFSKNEPVAASHPALAAHQTGGKPSVFTRNYLTANGYTCMPGRATEFDDVFALTPNTALNLNTRTTHRIYAGALERNLSVEEAARDLIEISANQLPWLASRGPVISLSAGLDSRSSLALIRPIAEQLTAYTYTSNYHKKNRYAKHDLSVAAKIAKSCNVPLTIIDIDQIEMDEYLKKILEKNFYKTHAHKLSQEYINILGEKVNIRSNVFGIARATYDSKKITKFDAEEMSFLAFGSKMKDPKAIESFQEFIDETNFPKQADMDLRDLFLWEHRIGVWQAAIYLEADLSHESHVLLNQREILRKLLSVPKADRIAGSVFKSVIQTQWPKLATYPVNGAAF